MAHVADPDVVEHEVRIDARPETVFEFLVDAEKLTRWKGTVADSSPEPGGRYRVEVTARDVVVGEYVEVDPPHRVVFTWGWEGNEHVPPGSSTVEITLTREDDGTLLRLVHRGLPVPARARHEEGWSFFLPRLAVAAAGGDPGPDPRAG